MQAHRSFERRRTAGRVGERGFTLLELLVAISVFGIAMAALTLTQLSTRALSRTNQETSAALDAAQGVIEAIWATDPEDVFRLYNANPGDDPVEGAPGATFSVRGLTAAADDADGMVGEVVFPGDGFELREDAVEPALGMPRDLDLDENLDDTDHSADYRLLPYMVRLRWHGAAGIQQVELVGTVGRR
jgi:prepilin-type N-terminal cleavage/methylation domain-containing protein